LRDNKYNIVIQNVVATASMGTNINLIDIMKNFSNVEYRPKKFPGLCFRLNKPKTATLIFRTGNMVCTGAKSEKLARRAVRRVVKLLKEEGFIIQKTPDIIVQNMVASAYIGGKIDLEAGSDVLDNLMYEPDQFPGVIYRMAEPKTVLLLFSSGKIVITGAKNEDQVHVAVKNIHEVLLEYDLIY